MLWELTTADDNSDFYVDETLLLSGHMGVKYTVSIVVHGVTCMHVCHIIMHAWAYMCYM